MDTTLATPEEEILHLRAQIEKKKKESKGFETHFKPEDHAHEAVREYRQEPLQAIVPVEAQLNSVEEHRLMEWLAPRTTDAQVELLAKVMADKGIKNALSVAEKLNNPEVEDDFERFLVQYLLSNHEVKNTTTKDVWKALHMQLFEIILPEVAEGQGKQMKEMMGLMEQWYTSMQSLASDPNNKEKNYYTLELAVSNGTTAVSFYCAVHRDYSALFEKVVLGVFPTAQVRECKEDYNIFHDHAITAASYATASTTAALPLKTYKDMEADPMALLLSSFTKIAKDQEGLALQLLIRPAGEFFAKRYGAMLDDLRRGETMKRAIAKQNLLKEIFMMIGDSMSSKSPEDKEKSNSHVDEVAMKHVQAKLEKTIVEANVRIIASAQTLPRVQAIRKDLESAFSQFTEVGGNSVVWK